MTTYIDYATHETYPATVKDLGQDIDLVYNVSEDRPLSSTSDLITELIDTDVNFDWVSYISLLIPSACAKSS